VYSGVHRRRENAIEPISPFFFWTNSPITTATTTTTTHSYGNDKDSCRWNSPDEVALREHVEAVNKKLGVEFKMS
jgi:hypothetical protein